MRIRRDIPNGYGVEARESFWIRAPKAAVLRSNSSCDFVRGAVSSGEEWSRPQLGRLLLVSVVSSRFLLSSQTSGRTR